MESLQKPEFNEKTLREKLEITLKKQMKMEREIGKKLIEAGKNMTPQEAKIFFSRKVLNSPYFKNRIEQRRKER
jgi:hypothetical protein